MKTLQELLVAEVEELILPGYADDDEPIEYEYTVTGYQGVKYTHRTNLESWYEWDNVAHYNPVFFMPGLGRVEVINHESGGEGATDLEIVWRVTSLIDGFTRLFKKTGYWVSHDGSYWDGDFDEVSMKTKVVTYYE